MKIFYLLIILFLGLSPSLLQAYSKSTGKKSSPAEVRSTMFLKKYMADFGTLVAGMEILRVKEKKPDWEAIDITIQEMDKTLQKMKQADKQGNYKEFTDALYQNLQEVKKYGKQRDKQVYEAFEKLTQTCFKCHAAHRPSDFPIQKEKAPEFGKDGTALLFQNPDS